MTAHPEHWSESAGWPVIAELLAGHWLGLLIAIAALLSAWSLFNGNLLYVSRLPFVMASDRWLPGFLAYVSSRSNVPLGSLIFTCVLAACLSALSFNELIVMDATLSLAALSLQFIALVLMRIKQPQRERPFKIPGGWIAITVLLFGPLCCGTALLYSTLIHEIPFTHVLLIIAIIVTGLGLYAFGRKRQLENIS